MSTLTKSERPNLIVSSTATDTGRLSWTLVSPITPFLAAGIGGPVLASIANLNFAEILHLGSFGFLALPIVAILSGILGNSFEAETIRTHVQSTFAPSDREILARAKKTIGPGLKLKMMFRMLTRPAILLDEMDGYKMTHTKAELVRRNGSYFIEIETMNALATWDLALESVVPEKVREEITHAAIAREAKQYAERIREETRKRDMRKRELWSHEYETDLRYRRQRGTLVTDEEDYAFAADYDEYGIL